MNKAILHTTIQEFITKNLTADIAKLLFKGSSFPSISIQELVEQIEAKNKCKDKLPTWFNTEQIYYPNKLNIEQTSSEITANYKANLISGSSIIDLTGGFGVDCFHFSKRFTQVTHCELDKNLSEIVQYNAKQLQIDNCCFRNEDGFQVLQSQNKTYDWIYADPSRRSNTKRKVFLLKDCLPNIPEHLNQLFEYSEHVLLKLSPILDIKQAISELSFVKEIHIVAVHNEVKELLFILKKESTQDIQIKTINIQKNNTQKFDFVLNSSAHSEYDLPNNYLYEPNAAILKSGGFHHISEQFNLKKLHANSHLYTSENCIDFPGRIFKIDSVCSFESKKLKKLLPSGKANISTRNFPLSVAEIRKKTKIKDGGNQYLFFTTDIKNNRIVLICQKV